MKTNWNNLESRARILTSRGVTRSQLARIEREALQGNGELAGLNRGEREQVKRLYEKNRQEKLF